MVSGGDRTDGYRTNLTGQGINTISLENKNSNLFIFDNVKIFFFNKQSINEKEKIAFLTLD